MFLPIDFTNPERLIDWEQADIGEPDFTEHVVAWARGMEYVESFLNFVLEFDGEVAGKVGHGLLRDAGMPLYSKMIMNHPSMQHINDDNARRLQQLSLTMQLMAGMASMLTNSMLDLVMGAQMISQQGAEVNVNALDPQMFVEKLVSELRDKAREVDARWVNGPAHVPMGQGR